MRAAAKILRGKHDFRAFSALGGEPKENTIRDLRRLDITVGLLTSIAGIRVLQPFRWDGVSSILH
jgi:tRNA U38,U39,U40 pseudouridine synthase TruA